MTTTTKHEQLDLRKKIVLNLKKEAGIEGQQASVKLVIDKSGSMMRFFNNGTVQEIVDRTLGLALGFDDDGNVEMYGFHDYSWRSKPDINRNTIGTVVQVLQEQNGWQGTNYAPAVKLILDEVVGPASGGFLGMGKKERPNKKLINPSYVVYITDGQNDDKSEMVAAMREASDYPIFWQFIGIGDASFKFLERLDELDGRRVDNANFFQANDIRNLSDEDLYGRMMKEFPDYIRAVRAMGLIQ
jgi:hypothetical protein